MPSTAAEIARSPGGVVPPPMPAGAILPPSAMSGATSDHRAQMAEAARAAAGAGRRPETLSLTWSYVPASATQIAYAPDGTLWALSTAPVGQDKSIWHLVNGSWTNIPGAAVQIAVAPDGSLWAVTSLGGLYHYVSAGWQAVGGLSKEIAVDPSGNVFVVAYGSAPDNSIWEYTAGAWRQVGGLGAHVASNPDGSLYVVTSSGAIYDSPTFGGAADYLACPGAVSQLAPLAAGAGFYALGYTKTIGAGSLVYAYTSATAGDCRSGTYQATNGFGVSLAASGTKVAVVGTDAAIYTAAISSPSPLPSANDAGALNGPLTGPSGGWGPTALANAFWYPVQSGFDGSGQTVAVIIDSAVSASDLATYLTYFKVPQTGRTVSALAVDGASLAPGGNGDPTEGALDVETIAGLAPGANVLTYVIPALTTYEQTNALNQIVSDGLAKVVSISLGGCENASRTTLSTVIASAAQRGIAFVASSGDQGSACYAGSNRYAAGVVYPASDPNATAVGGTETTPKNLTTNVVWNDRFASGGAQSASGGGVSQAFALPSYQSGLAGAASSTNRNVPDLALPAVDAQIYVGGRWGLVLGTSWGAPQYAAMLAEVYEYCNTSFRNASAIPYYVFAHGGYSSFLDVTAGDNHFSTSVSTPTYAAAPGYDNASGIGVPYGMGIAQTLCPNRTPAVTFAAGRAPSDAVRGVAAARRVDATPVTRALTALGRRAPDAETFVQLALFDTPSVAADEAAVIDALQAAGLHVVRTFSNHLVVDAAGTARAVEALFATEIDDVSQDGSTRYLPAAPAVIPPSLAPYVAGITLDDVVTLAKIGRTR